MSYTVWVDYSKRDNCLGVFDISETEIQQLDNWCTFEIVNNEIVITETQKYTDYLKKIEIEKAEDKFQNTIKTFTAGYSQAEIDTWATKVAEAKIVIAWGASDLLSALLLPWETLLDFANNIILKAQAYSATYTTAERLKREEIKAILSN